jgi:pimeloyl-ACP methyl ester carboxylesterase
MADIFISYSKGSAAQTEQLATELRGKGFTVWYDASLVPGDSFGEVILSELAQSRAAIVIWDAASVKSEWVRSEASRARARRILIPVRAEGIRSHDIPPPFDSLHTELISNRSAIEAALAKLGVIPTPDPESSTPLAPTSGATGPGAAVDRPAKSDATPTLLSAGTTQEIKYCRAPDGVRLAYAVAGSGPPLVKTANWMNHVEYDWESPTFRHLFLDLARDFTLLRYDARGNGLSDWDVDEVSLDAWVKDLEAVAAAAGLDRFPLFAMSQGCAISVAFAVRHPERVSHLILYGGFARGAYKRAKNELELQKAKALASLIRTGWGDDSPVYRQLFSSLFMPNATHEQLEKFAERQRVTTTAECAYRFYEATRSLDVTDLLPRVTAPTLVMHVRGDLVQPFEAGRELAAGIPGARFVALQGQNHMPLPQDPATERILEEIRLFLKA